MICRQPWYHGNRPFVVVQTHGAIVLRVRPAFAAAHWWMCRGPNDVKMFKTNLFHCMSMDCRRRNVQWVRNRSHWREWEFPENRYNFDVNTVERWSPPHILGLRSILPSMIWCSQYFMVETVYVSRP
jgi:hypothetical protein